MFDNLFNFEPSILLWAVIVFFAILVQIVISTVRVLMMVKGSRTLAIISGFFEASVGLFNSIIIVSNAVKSGINLYMILSYAIGFAMGLWCGMIISQKISKDILSVTIIPKKADSLLEDVLRENGFGVTCHYGTGKEGDRKILTVIIQKSNFPKLRYLVAVNDKKAMLTAHAVEGLSGGFIFDLKNKI
jgi:uncharacterized protein YebE (UPF0316 family)